MKKWLFLFILLCNILHGAALLPHDTIIYKNTLQGEIALHVFYPDNQKEGKNRPVIIHFFGGGWVGGNPKQHYRHCSYFASCGMVAISAEYRVKGKHKTTPFALLSARIRNGK
jgi:acetyl esterase/lipase